jgi:AraC-like DNA-binding protein
MCALPFDRSSVADAPDPIDTERAELVALLARHAPREGTNLTPVAGLELMRATSPRPRAPVISQPSICIVAQGSKRTYLGRSVYTYDPFHYLVLSVPLPIEGEIVEASPARPYLALRLAVDPQLLAELLLDIDGNPSAAAERAQAGIYVSRLDSRLLATVARLLAALDQPLASRVLGRGLLREALFHVLTGEQGHLLRMVAAKDGRSARIAGVLRHLQAHYHEELDVASLAERAAMSPSTLHHLFRAVTATTPMQYLKSVRLHQALRLMVHDGLGAAQAAYRVGYGSPSQFSREFRRLFGTSPREQVARQLAER